ncbi:methionine ABC transporter ATP-binding protein [Salinicoccus halodurans]|uniref:D-methionine transport system ATP-binding protein n=1 Tax=Salinicoccus halodurans TaxID=407035 RepID=A0A0F7HMX5_9STAP|nr:methionine ABC transporter ATP-binding protein [Salinicoccus halodurans]AKG74881.1 phosphate ABC transporter ATP-binding protein [Salinicoccus halodurans]SFK68973.1 D-methionine transport system ATP-binding protein [Salinicoccus halodurans]
MIEFRNLEKSFEGKHGAVHALKDINLTVEKGAIYGVVGFSGAGKSTLIRCVNYLEQPTAGSVIVDGSDLTQISTREIRSVKKKIGMVFQHFNLLNSKTVYANVAMPLILDNTPKAKIRERVTELLDFVGLGDKAKMYPDQLSGGQKQRVGIARALATQPSILLCDEATSALDPQTTDSILNLLRKINEEYNITILLITHEMAVVREICNRVAVMEDGNVIEEGTVFEIFSNPQTATGKNFVNTVMHTEIPKYVTEMIENGSDSTDVYRINFVDHSAGRPFLSQISKKFDLDVNVLFGNITELQGVPFGNLIVRFQGDGSEVTKALSYLEENKIVYNEVNTNAG